MMAGPWPPWSFLLVTPPSQEWEAWAKLVFAISTPLLIISGTLFLIAWKGVQTGEGVWFTLWRRALLLDEFVKAVLAIVRAFVLGDEFKKAVNDARKQAEWEFKELMNKAIGEAIREHERRAHRGTPARKDPDET